MLRLFRNRKAGPVFVCPADEARVLSEKLRAALVVSISDPERRGLTQDRLGSVKAKLCPLDFHDIERDAPGLLVPTEAHVTTALNCLASVASHRPVLVHCHAGVSRSSAIAIILAVARHQKSGFADDRAVSLGVSQVREATPHARPNMKIIEIGSTILKLDDTNFISRAWDLHRSTL